MRDYHHDLDGRAKSWNSGAEKLLGWSREEAVGMNLAEIFTPEDRGADALQTRCVAHSTRAPLMSGGICAKVPTAPIEHERGRGRVLVVEDNQAVAEFAAQLLEELSYTAVWGGDAQAGLDLIVEAPNRFDIVFSNVVIPGISGIQLAQRLRQDHPALAVVLTSGYGHALAQEGGTRVPAVPEAPTRSRSCRMCCAR